jgi:hypothetical protein
VREMTTTKKKTTKETVEKKTTEKTPSGVRELHLKFLEGGKIEGFKKIKK